MWGDIPSGKGNMEPRDAGIQKDSAFSRACIMQIMYTGIKYLYVLSLQYVYYLSYHVYVCIRY